MKLNLKDIKYVKICYEDRWDESVSVKGAITRILENKIIVTSKFEEKPFIIAPQDIELNFISDEGLYKTKTVLESTDYSAPYLTFYLQFPKNITFSQQREFFRVNVTEGAILSYHKNDVTERIICKTFDLSAKGVCIELPQRIDLPETVCLNIIFNNKEIRLNAKFIRFFVDNTTPKASFQFINPKEEDVDYISKICIQKQLENKRNKTES